MLRILRSATCALLLGVLTACTHEAPRQSIEIRHYRVDWSQVDAPILRQGHLAIRGILLTPAQWPLLASLKRLEHGDFEGMIDALDLRFRASRIPSGALQDLYDLGFVAAYVRVENGGPEEEGFDPGRLIVRINAYSGLPRVASGDLPARVSKLDWSRMGAGVALAALSIATERDVWAGPSSDDDRKGDPSLGGMPHLELVPNLRKVARGESPAPESPRPADNGMLERQLVPPERAIEGFVLFALVGPVEDWSPAHLELLH